MDGPPDSSEGTMGARHRGSEMENKSKLSQLSAMERQRRALEQRIQTLRKKQLLALPGQFGLESIDDLVLALLEHASPSMQERLRARESVDHPGNGHFIAVQPRVKFSQELREKIRRELEMGGKSVAAISREYGPSHPTIMGWKREWGMTRPRIRRTNGNFK